MYILKKVYIMEQIFKMKLDEIQPGQLYFNSKKL